MCPDFKFQCSRCGNTSFRSDQRVESFDDIYGSICSECYKPVGIHDITEHKIRRIQLIIQRKVIPNVPTT